MTYDEQRALALSMYIAQWDGDGQRAHPHEAPLPGIHYARIDGKLQRVSAEVYAQSYGVKL